MKSDSGKRLLVGFCALALATLAFAPLEAAPASRFNYDETKVGSYILPDALLGEDGARVTGVATWRSKRRGEILRSFAANMYGVTPDLSPRVRAEVTGTRADAVDGLATRTLVTLRFFDDSAAPRIQLMLYVPNGAKGPVPVFLGLNYFGNASVEADPSLPLTERFVMSNAEAGVVRNRVTEATRGFHASRWPLALLLRRGYAVATFFYGDIEEDHFDGWKNGLRGYVMRREGRIAARPDEWGALGAWGWGLSRALDYLETLPAVDARRVAVVGHSRHGKATLWAGAQDERFAIVISNDSGEGGASLARRDFGETIAYSIEHAAYRYCERFRSWVGRAAELPFDQHMLLGLIAPRPLYVASATLDDLSDPRGEFLSAVHAAPVYRLFGQEGVGTADFPAPDHPIGHRIGYHLRTGKHDIATYDWEQYVAFADRHFRKSAAR